MYVCAYMYEHSTTGMYRYKIGEGYEVGKYRSEQRMGM